MVYYPDGVKDSMNQIVNNAIIWLIILSVLLFIVFTVSIIAAFWPKLIENFMKKVKRFLGFEKVVLTVYSDKSKNYSGTEFLPIPVKAPTASFTYTFLGWNKFAKNEKGEFVVEPIFMKKVKTCIVNVYDDKNNLLETHEVEYGAGVKINHKLIIKQPTKEFEYEFIGWDKETKAFFENTEIRPLFKAKPIKYNYKFVLDDKKTVVLEKNSISGTPIICPTDPLKVDDRFIYEFVGWKGYNRGMVLDKNYVFEAVFEKKEPKTNEEKLKLQKNAIETAIGDFKKNKNKEKYSYQDSQKFKSSKMIVEKNQKPKTKKLEKSENDEDLKKEENKSLLKGVIVEKNVSKKKK